MQISRLAPGNWRSRSLAAVLGATVLLAGACDTDLPGPDGSGPVVDVLISTVPLNLPLTDLIPGTTRQLLAGPVNEAGVFVPGQTVTWSTSNAGVVSIDNNGLATAIAGGSATISAAAGGVTGTETIEVRFPVGTVTVGPTGQTIRREGAVQLTATTIDQSGATVTGRAVTWASLNPAVATVSATGLVSGVTDGTAVITATSEGATGQVTVTVFGSPVIATVTVSPSAPFMGIGTQQTLTATAKAGSGTTITDAVFAWTSSNPAVATVDPATGVVTVVGAGTATITATASGISGTAALRGAPGLTSGAAITPPTIAAEGFAIYAVVVPAGKTSLNVSTSGGSGDADVYVFAPGVVPAAVNTSPSAAAFSNSTTSGSCPAALSGNTESCTIANPAAGVWRVHVFAWGPAGAVTGLSLTATTLP
jgi:uncharacterized protein YjdB